MSRNRGDSGFTLIELMLVVAILSLLAAIAIPKFGNMIIKAKEAAVKANLGALRGALTIYYSDNEGIYPYYGSVAEALTTSGKLHGQDPSRPDPPGPPRPLQPHQPAGEPAHQRARRAGLVLSAHPLSFCGLRVPRTHGAGGLLHARRFHGTNLEHLVKISSPLQATCRSANLR
jgi:prepilin-type N-terminal cleavage/methylation domain-containing protein